MASAFWGGFAKGLKGRLDQENELELEMDKEKRLQDLKKKYEEEIIDSQQTQIVGNEEIRYNKFGTEISRRALSPEEVAMRKAAVDKATADARHSTAEAGLSEFGFNNKEEDRQIRLDDAESVRRAREASTAQGWAGLDIRERELDAKLSAEEQLDREEVTVLLFEAGDQGDASAMALLEQYDQELAGAKNPAELRRVIAKYKGLAKNRVNRNDQATRAEFKNGGASYEEGGGSMAPPTR